LKYNPLNFFKHWKKHGYRKTVEAWKKNYYFLDTPEQLLRKEIISYIGIIGAQLIALVILAFRGVWYISLIMLFGIGIGYYAMKGKLMQLRKLREMTRQFEEMKMEEE